VTRAPKKDVAAMMEIRAQDDFLLELRRKPLDARSARDVVLQSNAVASMTAKRGRFVTTRSVNLRHELMRKLSSDDAELFVVNPAARHAVPKSCLEPDGLST